jgi:hypothetical protein
LYHGLRTRGVHFIRQKIESIGDAAEYLSGHGAVINATALGMALAVKSPIAVI